MNKKEKVGGKAEGCRGSTFHHTAEKICCDVSPDNFFSLPKEGHDVISHVNRVC